MIRMAARTMVMAAVCCSMLVVAVTITTIKHVRPTHHSYTYLTFLVVIHLLVEGGIATTLLYASYMGPVPKCCHRRVRRLFPRYQRLGSEVSQRSSGGRCVNHSFVSMFHARVSSLLTQPLFRLRVLVVPLACRSRHASLPSSLFLPLFLSLSLSLSSLLSFVAVAAVQWQSTPLAAAACPRSPHRLL
jgi:hypothetical protein